MTEQRKSSSDSFDSFTNLSKLTYLDLINHDRPMMNLFQEGNYDLSFVNSLSNLEHLRISGFEQNGGLGTDYPDVSFAALSKLKSLSFDDPLGDTTTLLRKLNENGSLANLNDLSLGSRSFDNSILSNAIGLKTLEIRLIDDISFLNFLSNLEELIVYDMDTEAYDTLGNCSNLTYLDIQDGYIDDYSFISRMYNLKTLNLQSDAFKIGSLQPLTGAENLENLYIGKPGGSPSTLNLTGITEMKALKNLVLLKCNIPDHSILDNVDWINIVENDAEKALSMGCLYGFSSTYQE